MLVGEGGADGEAGGDSACSSAELQLVGVLRRGKCSGAAAATGREGRTGGARGRRSELGRVRFDPGQPWVQQLPGAADANPWCQTLPAGTCFEPAQVSLVGCAVPARHGSNGSGSALSAPSPGVRPTAEMEGWVAEERVHGELWGAAQSEGTLGRGLARWLARWRL